MPENLALLSGLGFLEIPYIYDGHMIYYSNWTVSRVKGVTSNNQDSLMGVNQGCPGHTNTYGHPVHTQLISRRLS